MRRFFLVACLALVFTAPARAALNRWTSGGPFGGTVEVLAFDPGEPGVVYAGTFGGVFRSADHGATWTAASFGLAGAMVVDIAVAPGSPGTLYTATDAGVQRSDDGGRTWQIPTLDERIDALTLDPSNPQTLYAAVRRAIHKSTDGGASWSLRHTLAGTADILFLKVDPQAPANVYAGTDAGLYRSQDGGSTFNPLPALGVDLITLAIDPADSQVLYAGTWDGVYKSTNRGQSWARTLATQYVGAVVVDPASPSTLLALGHEVFRSTNAGVSWSSVFDDQPVNHVAAFDPSSASTLLLGTSEGVYRSTDRGTSWLPSDTGLTASLISRLAVDPHRPGTLYASLPGPGPLYKSTDAGETWSRINGISQVRDIALDPKTPSLVYAATNSGLLRSQNGGATWVLINATELGINHIVIDPQTPSTLYTSRTQEGIRKSVDGGLTWSPAGPDVENFFADFLAIAPSEPQTLFASDFSGGLFKSTDGGATWAALTIDGVDEAVLNTLAFDPHDADVIYAAVMNEGIYKSTDGGATWSFSGIGLIFPNVDGIAIDPSDPSQPSRLYATNAEKGIFRSTDAGATWLPFDDGRLTGLSTSEIVLDPVNPFLLYAASAGGGVLARADLQPGSSLRLNGNRFLVKMSWATEPGVSGRGQTHALTGDTGYASFFQESNVEVLLKVLDVCGLNGHFWVFAAGLTTVRTDITVGDTQTGAVKIYHNPSGQPFQPIQDVNALACAGAASPAPAKEASAASGPSGPILLGDGRFQVTAEFVTAPGAAPQPMPGALLTDDAAYLWFFDSNNVEVFLKVVDGCTVNDRFWVFAAGLTNVEVRITVVDTQTGEPKVYVNPPGQAFQPILDTSAFEGCD